MIKQTILKQVTPGLLDLVIGNILKTTQIFIHRNYRSTRQKRNSSSTAQDCDMESRQSWQCQSAPQRFHNRARLRRHCTWILRGYTGPVQGRLTRMGSTSHHGCHAPRLYNTLKSARCQPESHHYERKIEPSQLLFGKLILWMP